MNSFYTNYIGRYINDAFVAVVVAVVVVVDRDGVDVVVFYEKERYASQGSRMTELLSNS